VLSSQLVPAKDQTLLFTNAGMNQFKGVFLQEEKREYDRAVSIQKCMRVSGKHNDFNEVGKTEFHHTFFEMMGNFSFGDYFKEKAIEYAWELLTTQYPFKPSDLWVSVYKDDDEAFKIWEEKIGVPTEKIIRLDEKSNFWQMGDTGPCGPCSEIHFDRGKEFGPDLLVDGNDRFIEIWNLVFMQYYRDDKGNLNPLPAPSIDTGMGMERLTALIQGVYSNYQTDLFKPIIEYTAELAGINPDSPHKQVDLKVIADHIRSLSFLISDGVLPSNEGRGYVLRRVLRRAAKHGKSLGLSSPFLSSISSVVIQLMKGFYPELDYNREFIAQVLQAEEERFERTLSNGLKRFEELLNKTVEDREKIISGIELFKLSDTYGFPLDFAIDLAQEKDLQVDFDQYQNELESQKKKSRESLNQKQKSFETIKNIDKFNTIFTGYENLEEESTLLFISRDGKETSNISKDESGILIFDKTPFYAESGGQIGDTGVGKSETGFFEVENTTKVNSGAFLHWIKMRTGNLSVGQKIKLIVDRKRRKNIAIHHSTTHLLHSALREVLGLHVKQAGSYVGPDKLRFDFTHFKALSTEEISKVENLVNEKIRDNIAIQSSAKNYEEAIDEGAIAIFEEKYSDVVRMLSVGDFSKELCGGTHLHFTGEAGCFIITNESSISSGIRRIEAIAGEPGFSFIQKNLGSLHRIQTHFRQRDEQLFEYLVRLEKSLKDLEKQRKKQKEIEKKPDLNKIISGGILIGKVTSTIAHIENMDRKQLSSLADKVKNKTKGIAILSTNIDGKSAIIVSIPKELTDRLNANTIIKEISRYVNGNGGGRPDFAQAGGDCIEDVVNFKKNTSEIVAGYLK
jgi:alanyl-tRNA synthetase